MAEDHLTHMPKHVAILGAGQAGGFLAEHLRFAGFEGQITIYGEEAILPYHRPPLSKDYLKGREVDLELRSKEFYREHSIMLRLGVRATELDIATRRLWFADGTNASYDTLVVATGVRPRTLDLEGSELHGIYRLRTVEDAVALRSALRSGPRIAIIGGGYIGLEVAASAIALGGRPLLLERQDRLLARVASQQVSQYLAEYHRSQGVEIITDADPIRFLSNGKGAISGVSLSDGRQFDCDIALLCVGAVPNDEIAKAGGIDCDKGIIVDNLCKTNVSNVFAIGDVTRRPLALHDGQRHRVESVQSALEQAKQVAAAIVGQPAAVAEVPWFWSDQYNIKLQIAGISIGTDKSVFRGQPGDPRFSVLHFKDDRLICLEAINSPGDFMAAKKLIGRREPIDEIRAADTTVPLKHLVAT